MNRYDKAFIENSTKEEFGNVSSLIQNFLKERKQINNRSFAFNTNQIAQIKEIKQFAIKEKTAYELARDMEKHALKLMKKNQLVISDYEIDIHVQLFPSSKYAHVETMKNCPIVEFKLSNPFTKGDLAEGDYSNWFFRNNHNEFNHLKDHPLKGHWHCWLFNQVYKDSILSWEDIIDVDEIWINVNLKYQQFSSV